MKKILASTISLAILFSFSFVFVVFAQDLGKCRNIPLRDSKGIVTGYTYLNDVTEAKCNERGGQWMVNTTNPPSDKTTGSSSGEDNTSNLPSDNTKNIPTDKTVNKAGDSTVVIPLDNPFGGGDSLVELLNTIIEKIIFPIGGVLAILAFIYAGFKYVTAKGDTTKIKEAHQTLLYVVIGTAILLGARVISEVISGTINQLK